MLHSAFEHGFVAGLRKENKHHVGRGERCTQPCARARLELGKEGPDEFMTGLTRVVLIDE